MAIIDHGKSVQAGSEIPHNIFYTAPLPISFDSFFYQVNRAGISRRTPSDFLISRNDTYAYNVVHCVISGRGSVTVCGKSYPLEEGCLFVLPAHELRHYCSEPDNPMELLWVEFGGGESDRLTKHIFDAAGPIFQGSVFQEVMGLCTAAFYHSNCGATEISLTLYAILMTLFRHIKFVKTDRTTASEAILNYVDAHLGERLTLVGVAGKFGYHPNYFSSRFSRIAGVPFSQYLAHRRLSQACRLLMTTEMSIDRIAHEVGFYDASHFVRSFKEAEGVTPSRYRRESPGFP